MKGRGREKAKTREAWRRKSRGREDENNGKKGPRVSHGSHGPRQGIHRQTHISLLTGRQIYYPLSVLLDAYNCEATEKEKKNEA